MAVQPDSLPNNDPFSPPTPPLQSAAMLMLLAGCTAASVSPAGFSVTNLRTEYLENPLGLDKARPRFSWELKVCVIFIFTNNKT